MKRALLFTPMLLVTALSAQVPSRPPATPPTPTPPLEPTRPWVSTPLTSVRPWVDVTPNIDFAYSTAINFDWQPLTTAFENLSYAYSTTPGLTTIGNWRMDGPVAWAQSDPADSLYRQARDQFNRGDYRKAAELFKSLPVKFANSAYVADAQYYQAFSLYRIGGTPELQEALAVLEARKPQALDDRGTRKTLTTTTTSSSTGRNGVVTNVEPVQVMYRDMLRGRGQNVDAAALAARIATVLSSRGLSNDAAVKRALAAGGNACNEEDQSVRAEALSAMMQNDPETGRQMAVKILGNKDECSIPLRRNAVMLVGNKHDDAATATLIPVAKSDPSPTVRMAAVDYLTRIQTDAAVNAVVDLARSDTSKQIQRAAIRALAQSTNPRARAEVRTIVENNTGDESLRVSVIDGLDRDRMTAEDGTWLRGLYAKTTSSRVKERIVSALSRAGGDANNQWLLALVRNEDESLDSRTSALQHVGRTMDLATLNKMYDASASRPIRRTVLDLLAERKEPAALDKIVDVAKTGTDVDTRMHAINILSRSKDPRAHQLLMQLVDH